jgi:hypothetical protein
MIWPVDFLEDGNRLPYKNPTLCDFEEVSVFHQYISNSSFLVYNFLAKLQQTKSYVSVT